MQKSKMSIAVLLSVGIALTGSGLAQQTPAASTKPATTAKTTTPAKSGTATKKTTAAPLKLTTDKEKASYAIGMSVGKKLHEDNVDIDMAILVRGLKDAAAGGKTLMTEDEVRASLVNLQKTMRDQALSKNKKLGDEYLAANKTKPGVVTLPSGLQYKVLQQGSGPKPTAEDSVVCNYKGALVDGKEFDSSYKRGEPATFPVTGVIKGWTEALQLMPVGSKWQLVIPPDLAYGESGRPSIPPNSTLVFEVELVKIAEKAKPAPPATEKAPEGQEPKAENPPQPQNPKQ